MIWQDKGFLINKNKYNENSIIAEFFTCEHGKAVGIIFGASSKKIRNYLLIGNKFHLNFSSKNDSKIGNFIVEIDKFNTPYFFDNYKKLSCIVYTMSLLKILTVENQMNKNIYDLIDDFFINLKLKNWIKYFVYLELNIFKNLGYELNFKDYVINKKKNGKNYFVLKNDYNKNVPEFLLNPNSDNIDDYELDKALKINEDFLQKSILKPNNLNFPISRNEFIKNIKLT